MGTKNNPGKFDCHAKAGDDEPTFTLLARDPVASLVVLMWVSIRSELGDSADEEKIEEATLCAAEMQRYSSHMGKDTSAVINALERVVRRRAASLPK